MLKLLMLQLFTRCYAITPLVIVTTNKSPLQGKPAEFQEKLE